MTLKHLQINNPINSTEHVTQNNGFKPASGNFQIQSTTNRATAGNFNQVTTPVGQHNQSMISNLNIKAGSVGPTGMTI